MLVLSAFVLLVGLLLIALGAVPGARQQAAGAADLAALAGCAQVLEGRPAVCQAAERVLAPVGQSRRPATRPTGA